MKASGPCVMALALLLCGCAAAPALPETPDLSPLLSDALFTPPVKPVDPSAAMAVSPAMREYLRNGIASHIRKQGPREGLVAALEDDLKIEYDAETTHTAAEAFAARAGNCLSLTMLTAALARELNVPVTYQMVLGEETWSRGNGLVFQTGHVNLVLGRRGATPLRATWEQPLVVDFMPSRVAVRLRSRAIPEETVLAMYLNNRAAELTEEGRVNEAYWWAREALKTAPAYTSAYNTLAVIYRRSGYLPQAERVLRAALAQEPASVHALGNLAGVLAAQGRDGEAAEYRRQLATLQQHPPFYFFDRGVAALTRGENRTAIGEFKKELARMPNDDELHFFLAVARLRNGELREARRELNLAAEHSSTRQKRAIYSAKLEHLKASRVN